MKRNLLLLFFFVCGGGIAFAQQLSTTRSFNREAKLMYGVAVCAADDALKADFSGQLSDIISQKKWDIELLNDLGDFPDVVFVFEDAKESIRKAQENDILPIMICMDKKMEVAGIPVIYAKNKKDAARKAGEVLRKMLYVGMRPSYSVVFEEKKDGYPAYRIPSVITLPDGRIVAFAEARGWEDRDCAENDIVIKISDDGGKNWGKLIKVAESGAASLNNPTAVYVEEKNRIILLFQEYPPKLNESNTGKGTEGENICRVYITYSDDRGETWTPKKDITKQMKWPMIGGFASGPGVAIRVVCGPDKGRILVPLNVSGGSQGWFNYLAYSDDLGESWGILPGRSTYGTNESQVVQVSDSGFFVNARCHRFSGDEVKTPAGWNPWNFGKVTRFRGMIPVTIVDTNVCWAPTQVRTDLPDPLCQGAIYRYSGLKTGERSRILFTNPSSRLTLPVAGRKHDGTAPGRVNGSVKVSYDEGETWSYSKRIYGNRFTLYQYSVLTNLGKGKIGCLFETLPKICFAVFDMEWLTSGTDQGK
ncbi:MAG: sialidase family protein [Odoribacter sp.]